LKFVRKDAHIVQVCISELSLVAEIEDKIAGHILFSRIKNVGYSIFDYLALAPMAVIPEFHKQGVGTKLIKNLHSPNRARKYYCRQIS